MEGSNYPYSGRRAALWNGTPQSVILLSPEWAYAEATSIAGDQQVGYVDYSFGGNGTEGGGGYTYIIHAALWRGTAESYVDLHPPLLGTGSPGDQRSRVFDTDRTSQVGYANFILPASGGGYNHRRLQATVY